MVTPLNKNAKRENIPQTVKDEKPEAAKQTEITEAEIQFAKDREASFKKRVSLIDKSTALSHEAHKTHAEAGAAAIMHAVEYRDPILMNRLYNGLHPTIRKAFGLFVVNTVNTMFRAGGIPAIDPETGKQRIENKKKVWETMPTVPFKYVADPKDSDGNKTDKHFSLNLQKGDNAAAAKQRAECNEALNAIKEYGEDALIRLEWMTDKDSRKLTPEMDETKFYNGLFSHLKKAAESSATESLLWNDLRAIAVNAGFKRSEVRDLEIAYSKGHPWHKLEGANLNEAAMQTLEKQADQNTEGETAKAA